MAVCSVRSRQARNVSRTPHIRKLVLLSILLQLADMTNAQTLPDSLLESGSVPGFVWLASDPVADSLHLVLLDHTIALAQIEERQTSFWYRMIPDIRVSASLGVQQLAFIDPTTFTPYVLPRDAYRLTVSLSISGILNFREHSRAVIQLEQLQVQKAIASRRAQQSSAKADNRAKRLQTELRVLHDEFSLVGELLKYTEILFEQGEIKFDELIRVRLQQSRVQRAIQLLELTLHD